MRDLEEDDRPVRPRRLASLALEPLSVADLEDYITELQSEMARARAMIDNKRLAQRGADALFRKG